MVNAAEKKLYFNQTQDAPGTVPTHDLMKQALGYARELERIV